MDDDVGSYSLPPSGRGIRFSGFTNEALAKRDAAIEDRGYARATADAVAWLEAKEAERPFGERLWSGDGPYAKAADAFRRREHVGAAESGRE